MSHSGSRRDLIVFASSETDKCLFMGSLIGRVGLDLLLLRQLEKAGKTRYETIVPYMRENDLAPTFTTTKYLCTFVEDLSTADAVILIVDIREAYAGNILKAEELGWATGSGRNIIVVIENMHEVQWNPQPYNKAVTNVEMALNQHGAQPDQVRFIPASSAHGDNILDLSAKSPWYSHQTEAKPGQQRTVIQAIDE